MTIRTLVIRTWEFSSPSLLINRATSVAVVPGTSPLRPINTSLGVVAMPDAELAANPSVELKTAVPRVVIGDTIGFPFESSNAISNASRILPLLCVSKLGVSNASLNADGVLGTVILAESSVRNESPSISFGEHAAGSNRPPRTVDPPSDSKSQLGSFTPALIALITASASSGETNRSQSTSKYGRRLWSGTSVGSSCEVGLV